MARLLTEVMVAVEVDLDDREAVCDAHKRLWHLLLDHQEFDYHDIRDFDNYDICNEDLVVSYIHKVGKLMKELIIFDLAYPLLLDRVKEYERSH